MQKRWRKCYKNLSKEDKINIKKYANNRNKNVPDVEIERRKIYIKNYHYKRKNCLNYLINHAEEVENISISREIFLNSGTAWNILNLRMVTQRLLNFRFPV